MLKTLFTLAHPHTHRLKWITIWSCVDRVEVCTDQQLRVLLVLIHSHRYFNQHVYLMYLNLFVINITIIEKFSTNLKSSARHRKSESKI